MKKRRRFVGVVAAVTLTMTLLSPTPAAASPGSDDSMALGRSAAQRLGWGDPLPASDEFNYVGAPDTQKWFMFGGDKSGDCWTGHDGNGRRCVDQNWVNGQYLRVTGLKNGDTSGVGSRFSQMHGRYEVRARAVAHEGATGLPYHPVLLLWPSNDIWPAGAEYDFFEVDIGDTCASAYMHYPDHKPIRQEHAEKCPVDITQWHNYAFEWSPDGVTGWIDGHQWFHFSQNGIQNAPGEMHLAMQLDDYYTRTKGPDVLQQAYLDIDWAHIYPYSK